MAEALRLRWQKSADGYRNDERDARGYGGSIFYGGTIWEFMDEQSGGKFLVPRNRRSTTIVIEAGKTNVLFDLAKMTPTPEGARLFANKWGLLDRGDETEVSQFYRIGAELWSYLHLMTAGRWSELKDLVQGRGINAGRKYFSADSAQAFLEPGSLREFCFLELFDLIERKAQVFSCPRPGCKGFYVSKRSTRRACSDACRKRFTR